MKLNLIHFVALWFLIVGSLNGYTQESKNQKLTLDVVLKSGALYPKSSRGIRPMKDGEQFSQSKKDSINVYSYKTGKFVKCLVTASELIPQGSEVPIGMSSYNFSPDESKILFATQTDPIFRHSSKSFYYIFDLLTHQLTPLSENGKQQLADFSPDSKKVAFVRGNNIFITDLSTGKEQQITTDGKDGFIINGTTDWVYEEEFSEIKGFYWSPDGKKLAFMRFDESRVKEWIIEKYGELYPEIYKFKYPKAGEENSIVTIHVFDFETGKTKEMNTGIELNQYIPRIKWSADTNTLVILRLNRLQNKLEILLANAGSGESRVIYSEENKYYIEDGNFDNIIFLEDGVHFVLTSEMSGYNHIYLYKLSGQKVRQITSGNWDVTDLLGVDQVNRRIYYRSAEVSPLDRNVYVVDYNGMNKTNLTPEAGTSKAEFSSNFNYFVKTWSDANTPFIYSVNSGKDGKLLRILQNNNDLCESRKEYNFQSKKFFTVPIPNGTLLNAWKIMPPQFDSTRKYPVLFDIYGGPGSQTVLNSYGSGDLWDHYLNQEGIIIVSVDNRGTGARGEIFKKQTYLQLGKLETDDYIETVKYLQTLPYVDTAHTGIFGWSYGGYMSALCMTKGAEYFDIGIAVAPVTNWRYYDNIYTERFMRTPQENPLGYDDNSPINYAAKLKGKLLLIHGMADDNVHAQNTYDFVTALVAANKDFDMMVYPNSNHGIYTGTNTTYHLYSKMTKFLLENLKANR